MIRVRLSITLLIILTSNISYGDFQCGEETYTDGMCCDAVWYHPQYNELMESCPAEVFYIDGENPDSNDNNPGTANSPWATIEHAAQTLTAGQAVLVRSGVYRVSPTGSRYIPAIDPANSGEPGAPIIIKSLGDVTIIPEIHLSGTVVSASENTITFDANASAEDAVYESWQVRIVAGTGAGQYRVIHRPNNELAYEGATRTATILRPWDVIPDTTSEYTLTRNGPLVGTLDNQHVVWDGFTVMEIDNYHPDTSGVVVVWGSSDITLINNEFVASRMPIYDNHNVLRIEGTERIHVLNNVLHGALHIETGINNPQNHAGIMIYASEDAVIENNMIYDSYTGIFPKGGNRTTGLNSRGHVIRYNVIRDTTKAVRISYHDDVSIYQNLIFNCDIAFQPAENRVNTLFFNNTVVDCATGVNNWFPSDEYTVFNNIFSAVTNPHHYEANMGEFVSNYNNYYGFEDFVAGNSNIGGLVNWQDYGHDLNSLTADPLFAGADTRDYRLLPESPLLSAGLDLEDINANGDSNESIPMGMYISGAEKIGIADYRAAEGAVTSCNDGRDNDGDGFSDYPMDAGCQSVMDDDESNCGDSVCSAGENIDICHADCVGTIEPSVNIGGNSENTRSSPGSGGGSIGIWVVLFAVFFKLFSRRHKPY